MNSNTQFIRTTLILFLLLYSRIGLGQDIRPQTYQVQHIHLDVSIRNFAAEEIIGRAEIVIKAKSSNPGPFWVNLVNSLIVDSLKINSKHTAFSHQFDRINCVPFANPQVGDSVILEVWYRGKPTIDPSGWGGFYFSGEHAFNLGVGFQDDPHTYGRAWHPCFDHFESRNTYSFHIETDTGYVAVCNGLLMDTVRLQGSTIWKWHLHQPIASYLAGVSVSKYHILKSTYKNGLSEFPVWLAARHNDSNNMKGTFENLHNCIGFFEESYGPQMFDKVGFNVVPFNGGAMEHASNITFPAYAVNGNKGYETLIAHELAHHWWGNSVTCKTASDMWLNEGWASYSEKLFLERMYGRDAYLSEVLRNHYDVLRFAHLRDSFPRAVGGVPHHMTYGFHVYRKGADVIHSLRAYVGDSAFFSLCRLYLENYKFRNASGLEFRDFWQARTNAAVNEFYDNWIMEKGFPHVEIIHHSVSGNGPFEVKLSLRQENRFTTKLYTKMPLEITFFKNIREYITRTVVINNSYDDFVVSLPFKPVYIAMDYNEKLSDAITAKTLKIASAGTFNLTEALMTVFVNAASDTSLLRVEHHWVGPERQWGGGYFPVKSNSRYWSVNGIFSTSFSADAEIMYDGRNTGLGSSIGNLDNDLIQITEDSLDLLYRENPWSAWKHYTDAVFTRNSKTDKQGKIRINNLKKGDYVLAMYDHQLSNRNSVNLLPEEWELTPNPASNELKIQLLSNVLREISAFVRIIDSSGKELISLKKEEALKEIAVDISSLPSGLYTVVLDTAGAVQRKKLVISR